MKNIVPFSLLLLFPFYCNAQYTVTSEHIIHPELNIEYVRKNVDFWIDHAYDPIDGGFFSNIDRQGNVIDLQDVNTRQPYKRKSLISQTRHGYGFTRAFMLTGDDSYLDYARNALDFLFDYGWDSVNDGWYCFAKSDGSIDHGQYWDPNTGKWGFQQHYALVGIVANYEATRNKRVEEFMNKGVSSLYDHLWDSRPGYEGYYEDADLNWTNKNGKGFTSTVDAITTNAELSYLVSGNPEYKTRLLQLADIIVNRFIPQMDNPNVKALYPESFTTNWTPTVSATTTASIGHFVKTAWCLGRAYLCDTSKTGYRDGAVKILNQAWEYGNGPVSIWDHQNGGLFNELNLFTGGWGGSSGDCKDYWTVEQGFTGSMINYYITGNDNYLNMADGSLEFFMEHLVDAVDGEIFSLTDAEGLIVKNDVKGDDFKASYHSCELGYYAYLYSSLYYLHQSADLYYKFDPSNEERQITLTPLPIEENRLKIQSVTLDGNAFDSFNAQTRTLTIAPNQSGKFKVTFQYVPESPSSISEAANGPVRFYPNPVKEWLYLEDLSDASEILLIDLMGKTIHKELVGEQSSLKMNLQQLNDGVYFIVVQYHSGKKSIHKIIKS